MTIVLETPRSPVSYTDNVPVLAFLEPEHVHAGVAGVNR